MRRKRNLSNADKGRRMGQLFAQAVRRLSPGLAEKLAKIPDPRAANAKYRISEIVFAAIAMFVLRQPSRNAMNSKRDRLFAKNFVGLFGMALPHMDTVNDVMKRLDSADIEQVKIAMVRTLLENKTLRSGRVLDGKYLVAIDATGVETWDEPGEGMLFKVTKNGKIVYMRMILEAKLVTASGFAISLMSEWLTNEGKTDFDKQDSELGAFKRLAARLRQTFPRLPMCILADSLYPSEQFMDICAANRWSYCAVLKDTKLLSVQDQVDKALTAAGEKQTAHAIIMDDGDGTKKVRVERTIEWVGSIAYRGYKVSWISVEEVKGGTVTRFAFITDLKVDAKTASLIVGIGRQRWSIEDAFNTQKNRGFSLGHKFSRKSFGATKSYYQALQIAHLLSQMVDLAHQVRPLFDHSKETIIHLWETLVSALGFPTNPPVPMPSHRSHFRYD